MSVATADLLAAAKRIFDNGTTEADWRAVCSRGYYAVYHDIQAFADSLAAAGCPGQIPSGTKPGRHHLLYTGLKNPTIPKSDPRNRTSFKLGLMAQSLHSTRIKADYHPEKSIDQAECNTQLTTAHNIPAVLMNQPVGTPLPKFGGPAPSPGYSGSPLSSGMPSTVKKSSGLKVVK